MLKKEKILNYLRNPEDKSIVAKVLDKIETAARVHEPQVSDFYDPYYRNLIEEILPGNLDVNIIWSGGYADAERQRLAVFPSYMEADDIDMHLTYLKIFGNMKFQELSHRDYMGAVLHLGIKREKIGDFLPIDEGCQLIVDSGVATYIEMNLDKIHRVAVKVNPLQAGELILPEEKYKEIKATVSSLRLDAVAGAGFGLSRSEIADLISAEKVKLNWAVTTDSTKKVGEQDVISVRGKGRMKVEEVGGETKKGRIYLVIKRFV